MSNKRVAYFYHGDIYFYFLKKKIKIENIS